MWLDAEKFEHIWKYAQVISETQLIPLHFQKKPADCFVALQFAARAGIDPMLALQKMYIIGNKPAMEAQLMIALANGSGRFRGNIQYKDETATSCTAYVVTHEGEVVEYTLDWKTVEAEGWNNRKGSKWISMRDLMFRYRSAAYLISTCFPELKFGLLTKEEAEDINTVEGHIANTTTPQLKKPEPILDQTPAPEKPKVDPWEYYKQQLDLATQAGDVEKIDDLCARFTRKLDKDDDKADVSLMADQAKDLIAATQV